MTRVTFATYDDSPPLGGQGVMLVGMRRALEQRGVDVRTVSGRGEHAITYARVTGRPPLDLSLHLIRRSDVLVRESPDVVHANGGPGGVLLPRRLSVPLVYTAHHTYTQAHSRLSPYRIPAPLEARGYRNAAMVLAVSASTATAVRAMGVARNRVEVLAPGVEIPASDDVAREPARMLFLGRLEDNKGVLDAVDLMRDVLSEVPGARGVIAGSGSRMSDVRARIAAEDRIDLLGTVDAAAAQRELARATVVLMPSRYEGLGLVALEAQAAGTPVAGFDVDGLRDAVRGGVLVAPGRKQELRSAVVSLLRDDARRQELGARGRDFVVREHSWDRVGERLLQVYAAASGS